MEITEKIRLTMKESPIDIKGIKVNLTLSIGTVNHENDNNLTVEDLLGFADGAMYTSKKAGRSKVSNCIFSKSKSNKELVC